MPMPTGPPLSPFADYQFISLPDLSTTRRPPDSREHLSVCFRHNAYCPENVVLVALARCLGAYCGASNVLLGWQPADSPDDKHSIIAARVRWADASTYEDVLDNLLLQGTEDSPANVRRDLGIDIDDGLQPFLAVLTPKHDYGHPLVVSLESGNGSTQTLYVSYSTRLLHASTAELLANQICTVAERIASKPSFPPADLRFLPDEFLSIVPLRTDSSSYTQYPEARTVADFIPRHDPSVVALEYYPDLYEEDPEMFDSAVQKMTYRELDRRSSQFAAYLCAQGLQLEDRVTLCMPRGVEFHIAMMGVFKSGGCYVPIDPELPQERQSFINEDSGARFMLTADNIKDHMAASESFPEDPINKPQSDGLAYLLYTSGTTGTPKGCLLTHDGFAQAIHALSWFANQAGPNKRRWPQAGRYLAVASVAFDVHLAEVFVGLSLGMTLVSAPRSQLLEDLPRWVNFLHVTHVGIVPSLIEATMHAVVESAEGQRMDMAYIASGGEKMSDAILDRWADHPLVTLANFYGPSELTIGCSARLMTSSSRKESVGRIFENCSAYVVDENLKVVVRGGLGELVVGGRLVGRGYHNRLDLTEKAFVQFSHGSHSERVYRTGDLVRLMPDDTLEILGRIDSQIKLRGVRIESEGVSSVIRNAATGFHGLDSNIVPDVSTILSRHPQLNSDQLVSFIGLDSSKSIAHRRSAKPHVLGRVPLGLMRTLNEACRKHLASYMRPAHIVPLDFLPLNQSGKTDNKVLDALFRDESLDILGRAGAEGNAHGGANEEESSRALTEMETKIAQNVARYTDFESVQLRPSSNLFQLGFDSLKFVRLASNLRSAYNAKSISVSRVIQNPTIEGIATVLEDVTSTAQERPRQSHVDEFSRHWKQEVEETYGAEKVDAILPTFPVQDGVLYRSADLNTLYIQHVVLKIHDGVETEKLKSAWAALMAQHEILRTVFHFSSALVQVILKSEACELPWIEHTIRTDDMGAFHSNFLEGDAVQFARTINDNISTSPAFKVACYRLEGRTEAFLTLSIHHAIYDGISLPLLLRDVEALYLNEEPQHIASVFEVLEALYDVDMDEAAFFWQAMFDGFNWSKIPKRLASGETASVYQTTLDTGLSQWERDAAQIKVSLQAVLTAAFAVRLAEQMYGVADVVFGVIRTGRSFAEEELNDSRAPLLTVLPIRVNADLGTELLQTVQSNIGSILAFEHVPLGQVQKWVQPYRPLFEVLFSLSIDEGNESRLWDIVDSKQPQADYILAVEVELEKKSGQIRIDCAYTEPLKQDDVSRIIEGFERAAKSLVEGRHELDRKPRVLPQDTEQFSEEDDGDDVNTLDVPVDEELEDKIQSIIEAFLKVEKDHLSRTSSLIALGLDSIKSVGLSRALRREGVEISPIDLMRRPSVRHISAHITIASGSSIERDTHTEEEALLAKKRAQIASCVDERRLKLKDDDDVQLYPTTVLQAGMLSQTIGSGGHLYVHAFPFKLTELVDMKRLRLAWRRVVQYFDMLRTSFHFIEKVGTWIQAVHSSSDVLWDEASDSDVKSFLDMTEGFIKELGLSSEDKFASPPAYMRLYRSGTSRTLVLVLHHALYDGISISRLADMLWKFYREEVPAPSPQFADFLGYFERQELHGTDFWTKQLHGFKKSALLRKTDVFPEQRSISASAEIPLSADRMSEACRLFDATVQCFGQATLAKILSRLYNRRDLVFGHVVSGRNVRFAEDVFGPMISTLPYRSRISPELKNLEFVRSIHRQNMAAQRWQHASLRSIQRKAGLSSLWDAIFLFQPIIDDNSAEMNELWSFDDSENEVAKIQYPLNVELHQHPRQLVIKAACQAESFDENELNSIVKDFSKVFMELVHMPQDFALSHLPVDDQEYSDTVGNSRIVNGHDQMPVKDQRVLKFIDLLAACVDVPHDSIQPDTPLISLGVDSITAIHISTKAREAGIKLHAADVLRCHTPVDVASILDSKGVKKDTPSKSETRLTSQETQYILDCLGTSKDLVQDILPASAGMEWLIGMWQLSERARFQHAFAFELPNGVDEYRLRSAWSSLVQNHPILRSTFVSTTGNSVQIVVFKSMPEERLWTHHYLTTKQDPKAVIREVTKELVSKPLSTDLPPCQAVFLSVPTSNYFIIHLHHFQYDAWSLRLLMDDLQRCYESDDTDARAPPSSKLSSFLDNCNSSDFRDEQMHAWKSYLPSPFKPSLFSCRGKDAGNKRDNLSFFDEKQTHYLRSHLPSFLKPSLFSKAGQGVAKMRERFVYIDRSAVPSVSKLRQKAQEMSLSLNVVYLACWARVQARYSNTGSATFGLWHLGRAGVIDDIESLPIPCMNVLPIHIDVINASVSELANHIQTTLRQRTAIVEQSHLVDINRWSGGDKRRVMMNTFVNIVATGDVENGVRDRLLNPVDLPYLVPTVEEAEVKPTAKRLDICDLMNDAILIDFVTVGENVTMSIEYTNDYLDENTSRMMVMDWGRLVKETLR